MEISLKSIVVCIEPIIAFIFTINMVGEFDWLDIFRKSTLTIEEEVRILMSVMFSLYYLIKTIRFFETKDQINKMKDRIDKIEKDLENK